MFTSFRLHLAQKLLNWSKQFDRLSTANDRGDKTVLIFLHGYSLAHTIRPLVIARILKDRGYHVVLAGRGPHVDRVRREGFELHDVETMPQSRMDECVERGDYAYYDHAWIDRCVSSERVLMQVIKPNLVIHDMKPTAEISARLEGIDDARIAQAYNQPGYAEPIAVGEHFGSSGDLFDEYLGERAEEVKPQRSFYLMADIPEFHPSGKSKGGYYYVGPLHDRPAPPENVDLLDEGWDISLPLIYVTCGSSGRPPDYLDELVAAVRDKPYRVLVTTAGRWTMPIQAENVRVVDYLPGEWILAKAEVMVGIVGIGAIYQALRCGVPIIGAPEHLDQEYHLNRVEALGVGIKLQRRVFDAEHILAAIEMVLNDCDRFRTACAPFVQALAPWDGGGVVADLLDAHFRIKDQVYRVDDDFLVEESEFVAYLVATTPLERECVEELLADSLTNGMPHRRVADRIYYDRIDSWNWLYDHEPRFFEADYRALEEKRQCFSKIEGRVLVARNTWQGYRVTYRLQIYPDGIEAGQQVRVHIPVPVEKEGHQHCVEMHACSPKKMEGHLAQSMGFIYGYGFEADEGPWDFSYTCELSVCEQRREEGGDVVPLALTERTRCLELEENILQQPEVVRFRALMQDATDDEVKARIIYDAIANNKRFKKTKDHIQNNLYSTVATLSDNGGHCITLTRAFISLCRAEGIPAREVNGALIGYPDGEGRFRAEGRSESLIGHTWAEIYLRQSGWIPVEFHGIVIGEQAMTKNNVRDPRLAQLIKEQGPVYSDYYFGHLDNQRLIYAAGAKELPLYEVEDVTEPLHSAKRWQMPEGLRFDCTLEIECT
jgi:UDP:flavonoid glycosyltransferase YjiC (YdhE family)